VKVIVPLIPYNKIKPFLIQVESNWARFLSINIHERDDGTLELKQMSGFKQTVICSLTNIHGDDIVELLDAVHRKMEE
jgi:hypothetical protein